MSADSSARAELSLGCITTAITSIAPTNPVASVASERRPFFALMGNDALTLKAMFQI